LLFGERLDVARDARIAKIVWILLGEIQQLLAVAPNGSRENIVMDWAAVWASELDGS
jgi:hypothetical protein